MAQLITAITMPKWGIEMTEGMVSGWRIAEGQRVERGAEVLDVETEKIVNAVEAPASGVLRRIMAAVGETHSVGVLIGVIADAAVSEADIGRFIESFVASVVSFEPGADSAPTPTAAAAAVRVAQPAPSNAGAPSTGATPDAASDAARVSPIARRIAERLGVDLAAVKGTGRNGRISKEDVEAFAARATTENPALRVSMSARRNVIARRLLESKQSIPHYRLAVDVDFGALLQEKRARAAATDRASLNDWLLRAAALALVQHPMVNAQLDGNEIVQFENADIAIAVAVEAGLVTPILRAANLKPLAAIARESRDLIGRARLGTLNREEISGGSFTISNLGMQGIARFDAIINAPQVAILAVGAVGKRPVVRGDTVGIGDLGTLTLSADHRVVDGAVGSAFLATLVALLQRPELLASGSDPRS
jgi:pyruvate dehydrogenase E2 component (dihydrolipoamide acetyltransferase)